MIREFLGLLLFVFMCWLWLWAFAIYFDVGV